MREKHFYLEFKIGSQARFDALHRFFAALRSEKDRIITLRGSDAEQVQYDPVTDPRWLDFLDEQAIAWFANTFDYISEEGKTYQELWKLTAPEVRLSHPMFRPPGNWDFESMIDSLFNGNMPSLISYKNPIQTGYSFTIRGPRHLEAPRLWLSWLSPSAMS